MEAWNIRYHFKKKKKTWMPFTRTIIRVHFRVINQSTRVAVILNQAKRDTPKGLLATVVRMREWTGSVLLPSTSCRPCVVRKAVGRVILNHGVRGENDLKRRPRGGEDWYLILCIRINADFNRRLSEAFP